MNKIATDFQILLTQRRVRCATGPKALAGSVPIFTPDYPI